MIPKMTDDSREEDHSSSLLETSRRDLISQSRRGSKKRYNKRINYQVSNFKGVDLAQLFENDYFVFKTPINDYECVVAFPEVLDELKKAVKPTNGDANKVTYQMVLKALRASFDKTDDVKVDCTCADWCLAPGTKIKMLDGRDLTVEELLEEYQSGRKDLWTYSVSEEDHDFRPGHISDVWISGETDKLVEVTLDNGEVITCTPDHLFMLRDGTYKEAIKLTEGQSLMPLYFQCNTATSGYDTVKYNSRSHGYNSVYKEVAKYLLQDEIEEARVRSGEDNIAIHHLNYDKHDNRPENLKPMGVHEHWKFHADSLRDRRKNDLEFDRKLREASRKHCYELNANPTDKLIEARKESGRRLVDSINNDPEKRAYTSQRAKESQREYWGRMTPEERSKEVIRRNSLDPDHNKKISESQKRAWSNYSQEDRAERGRVNGISLNGVNGEKASERSKKAWKDARENAPEKYAKRCEQNRNNIKNLWAEDPLKLTKGRCRGVLQRIVDEQLEMTEENYFKLKGKNVPKPETYWNSFDEMCEELGFKEYNHKVVSIKEIVLEEKVPVYDLTVDDYNNFLVSAGVVLHNCYRFAYWATQNGYKYGKPETRPSNITNPDNNIGATCKHLDLFLSSKRWLIKAASVVTSLIKTYPEKAAFYLYDEEDLEQEEPEETEEESEEVEETSEEEEAPEEVEEPVSEPSSENGEPAAEQ